MTDGSASGTGRSESHGGASGSGGPGPRRMSYASVASGTTSQNLRAGAFAHMATTVNSHSTNHPNDLYQSSRRYSQEPDNMANTYKQQLPAYSRRYAALTRYGSKNNTHSTSFFVPSYLKDSRYVEKLEAAHEQKQRSERETRSGLNSGSASLNASSSGVNVHRIAPSHRGMTYEVVESNPPKDEDQLMPLPTRWNEQDRYPGLDLSNDGLDVRYNGSTSKSEVEAASVRADYPMSPACGVYYYEVEIKPKSKDCAVAIGFSTSKASLERLPGWEPDSWAYHGDDGKTFCGEHNGRNYNQQFSIGDVIGCGINFNTGQAFFTRNGLDLGVAFRDLKSMKPFPCVGVKKSSGAIVSVNFGQRPFVFKIDDKVAAEKTQINTQIKKTKTTLLHPKSDEHTLVQDLVSQFLLHGGYVETSRAFEEEMQKEKKALSKPISNTPAMSSGADTTGAATRQQIRRAILAGDIDLAFDITNEHFPEVLHRYPEIVFHLKCRKWIELISRAADLRSHRTSSSTGKARKASDGLSRPSLAPGAVEDVFDQHMELDEGNQVHNLNGKTASDTVTLDHETTIAYNQLLNQAMDYGQILQREYRDEKDGEYTKTLQNIFSLIVYPEPRESVHGNLLDSNGRVKVAEELNSAILVRLGRSPTAALENTYKQTEALLDLLGSEGGPAAFINLRATFEHR